mmetsp:Transcript_25093/g.54569  ORF Transcript_25093/g.54569 Transcript_25093/m.54569 type:complete len:397 (-) Transcript_25093:451-1641(-)
MEGHLRVGRGGVLAVALHEHIPGGLRLLGHGRVLLLPLLLRFLLHAGPHHHRGDGGLGSRGRQQPTAGRCLRCSRCRGRHRRRCRRRRSWPDHVCGNGGHGHHDCIGGRHPTRLHRHEHSLAVNEGWYHIHECRVEHGTWACHRSWCRCCCCWCCRSWCRCCWRCCRARPLLSGRPGLRCARFAAGGSPLLQLLLSFLGRPAAPLGLHLLRRPRLLALLPLDHLAAGTLLLALPVLLISCLVLLGRAAPLAGPGLSCGRLPGGLSLGLTLALGLAGLSLGLAQILGDVLLLNQFQLLGGGHLAIIPCLVRLDDQPFLVLHQPGSPHPAGLNLFGIAVVKWVVNHVCFSPGVMFGHLAKPGAWVSLAAIVNLAELPNLQDLLFFSEVNGHFCWRDVF